MCIHYFNFSLISSTPYPKKKNIPNSAMALLKVGDFPQAEIDAGLCVQKNRTYTKGFFRRALARKAQGKLALAIEDLGTVCPHTVLLGWSLLIRCQPRNGKRGPPMHPVSVPRCTVMRGFLCFKSSIVGVGGVCTVNFSNFVKF